MQVLSSCFTFSPFAKEILPPILGENAVEFLIRLSSAPAELCVKLVLLALSSQLFTFYHVLPRPLPRQCRAAVAVVEETQILLASPRLHPIQTRVSLVVWHPCLLLKRNLPPTPSPKTHICVVLQHQKAIEINTGTDIEIIPPYTHVLCCK
jgi:hypothetical protein